MQFSAKTILSVFAATLLAGVRADDCSDGPVDNFHGWGKQGYNPSTPFCQTKWTSGLVVTGLEVWADKDHIDGLQFTFSDGSKGDVIGTTAFGTNHMGNNGKGGDSKHSFINWDATEKVDMMKCATSKDGRALGLIYIEVAGQKLSVGSVSDGDTVNVASGLLIGASGEVGGASSTGIFTSFFTPLFMGINDNHAKMTAITFDENIDDVNKKQAGITSVTLSEVYIKNTNPIFSNNTAQAWTFVGSTAMSTSSSMSTTNSDTFGVSEAIEIGGDIEIPFLAEAEFKSTTTMSYQYQYITGKTVGSTDTQTIQWSSASTDSSDLILPGHAKHCTATIIEGNYHGDYTSTIQITVGGKPFSYQQRGTFDSISYTDANSECNDILIYDIPGGANSIDAALTIKGKRQIAFLG